jgi:S-adenosylmethionine decarboxylase
MGKSKKNVSGTIPFGLHVMIDAYNCDQKPLGNKKIVYSLLNNLPKEIGMRKLMKPYVLSAEANDNKDPGGLSGFVMIQESHISIHTFVKRRFLTADVYSCKEFDTKKVVNYFKKIFKTKNVESIVEVRGKKYPDKNLVE